MVSLCEYALVPQKSSRRKLGLLRLIARFMLFHSENRCSSLDIGRSPRNHENWRTEAQISNYPQQFTSENLAIIFSLCEQINRAFLMLVSYGLELNDKPDRKRKEPFYSLINLEALWLQSNPL